MAIKKSYMIAGLLAAGLTGWLVSGQLGSTSPADMSEDAEAANRAGAADAAADPENPSAIAVRVQDFVAEPIEREIIINGKTEAARSVEIRAEVNGQVVELAARKGAFVDEGDVLIRLDPQDRALLKRQAETVLNQRRIELEAAKKLGEKGFQAETGVALAEANFATAEAALKRAEVDLDETVIRAPFAGVLDRRHVEIGDYVDIGDPVAIVIDQDPYLVTGDVTETEVGKLEAGTSGKVRLATGKTAEGRLRYVGSQADEQTRTFEVELEVPNPEGRFAAGVSAEIRLAVERVPAHKIMPSVLALSDDGTLGVKTVDEQNVVVFMPVEIAKAERDHVWLTGLPKEVRVITVGQGFVSDGIEVRPMLVDHDGNSVENDRVVSEATR